MDRKRFEFLDITTADVAFAAYGDDLKELFINSAKALFEVMVGTEKVEPKTKKEFEVSGHDMKSLMFNWLSELIFLSSSENMVFSHFDVKVDQENLKINAKCYGEGMDRSKHELRTEVKAATYHQMEIEEKDGKWRTQVILDV